MGSIRVILRILVLALLANTVIAQQAVPGFDEARLFRDIETLSADNMEGRKIATPGIEKARGLLLERFAKTGLKSFPGGYRRHFEYKGRMSGANVVGYIPGRRQPNKYILVTAHYDHLGVRDGEIYNGADDNASGTAAMLALAGYFAKNRPERSIIFAAFDGEESGLLGSKRFVKDPPVPLASILVVVNVDMVSRSVGNELHVVGTGKYPALKPYVEEVARNAQIKLTLGHDGTRKGEESWIRQSDQYPFHKKKIPFIYFAVDDHRDYHKPTDDFENIDQTFYLQAVNVVLVTVRLLDKNLGNRTS
jgi:Zn-dependent M28 family amino/carboxypeptidase